MNAGNKFSIHSNKHYDEELVMMLVTTQLLIWFYSYLLIL